MGKLIGVGQEGRRFHLPVDGGTTIEEGVLVAQLVATGMLVPAGTAGAGPAFAVSTHKADNSGGADGAVRCMVETDREFIGDDAGSFGATSLIGAPVFAASSTTFSDVASAGSRCGTYLGEEANAQIRVYVSAVDAASEALAIQTGSGTLAAGVLAVSTGIRVTATSRIFTNRVNGAGTQGDEIRVPTADRTVGGPGTGALTFRAFLDGAAATSDTSTFEYMIVG